ncbi:MAG: hypothetical protein GX803_01120 [Lentisphaerae bacterium]|nr:hypothetical protein [Lentisphaerota bacterium]
MSRSMVAGLLILAAFVVVLIMTSGSVTIQLFAWKMTWKTSYVLLGAAGIGVVAGALLRR